MPTSVGREFLDESLHIDIEARQRLISEYQETYGCRLVVVIGEIAPPSVTVFEDVISAADPAEDLHVLLNTPGGHGETAIRLARQAQARCRELVVVVPDIAKSAGTLWALGANRILMGPTSDLGPVDPQIRMQAGDGSRRFQPAKAIIEAVKYAEHAVQEHPDTFPLHAALLANLTAVEVQTARNELDHAGAQLRAALRTRPDLSNQPDELERLAKRLETRLIEEPQSHGATISADDASDLGLPIQQLAPSDPQWKHIWRLWTRYFTLGTDVVVFEAERVSHLFHITAPGDAEGSSSD